MNFFQRRKILQKVNYLDLVPVRLMDHEVLENGKVDILLPRFKNIYWKRLFYNTRREENIRIHLDEIGSQIWLLLDGRLPVRDISEKLQAAIPEKLQPPEETDTRVTQFLSLLYQEDYLTFREIMNEKTSGN
ncbi:MAG: PqqD family protein [Bacteroidota bacterium]|nr:PqqD family protein [Bacteroidota bacterium]